MIRCFSCSTTVSVANLTSPSHNAGCAVNLPLQHMTFRRPFRVLRCLFWKCHKKTNKTHWMQLILKLYEKLTPKPKNLIHGVRRYRSTFLINEPQQHYTAAEQSMLSFITKLTWLEQCQLYQLQCKIVISVHSSNLAAHITLRASKRVVSKKVWIIQIHHDSLNFQNATKWLTEIKLKTASKWITTRIIIEYLKISLITFATVILAPHWNHNTNTKANKLLEQMQNRVYFRRLLNCRQMYKANTSAAGYQARVLKKTDLIDEYQQPAHSVNLNTECYKEIHRDLTTFATSEKWRTGAPRRSHWGNSCGASGR